MKLVVQRVRSACVTVDDSAVAEIGRGLLVYAGVAHGDTCADVRYLAAKTAHLRVFEDEQGRMQHSVEQDGGAILVVSQFTLYGDCTRGHRPDFTAAAPAAEAEALLDEFVRELRALGRDVQRGRFGAHMCVASQNDGPVTVILESRGRSRP